ncbi:DUF1707 SHOCT-like domain-containing protein [Streptomyces lycii]|uniref:DUF1707 domain-containing protein n=1 Tax=Streptomyces lycii TaxID=2654337 RepID=A0ABQ7FKD1_9ACTN|nr:DUF1707 domain-containing protein [Streptomyces lycii]KAF4408830.1 DUF1707 domain-containing protein [Streptomyces lycii]
MTSEPPSEPAEPLGLPELRASDADRERVVEVLREALAEGRLDMDEFDQRLDAAYTSRTYGELEPLTRDLPVPGGPPVAPPLPADRRAAGSPARWSERIGGRPSSTYGVGILGGFQRKGGWVVPRRFTAVTVMGGGEIDLRDARFEDREVVIRCFAVMGGASVVVPPGVEVDVRGIGIMGGFDQSGADDHELPVPGAPRVVVTGFAFWGGVGVIRKLPKAERKRLKEERRRRELEGKGERGPEKRDRGEPH